MVMYDKDTMSTLDKLRVLSEDGQRVGLRARMEEVINWMEEYYGRLENKEQKMTKKRKSTISKSSSAIQTSQKQARREKQVHRSLKQGSKLSQSSSSTPATTYLDQIVFSALSQRYGTQSLIILPVSPPKKSCKEVVKPDSITSYQRSSIRNPIREYSEVGQVNVESRHNSTRVERIANHGEPTEFNIHLSDDNFSRVSDIPESSLVLTAHEPTFACISCDSIDDMAFGDAEIPLLNVGDIEDDNTTFVAYEGPGLRPSNAKASRSIEIFFGSLLTFEALYEMLCSDVSYRGENDFPDSGQVDPAAIKKLVFVGHPIQSFSGISMFTNLAEAWVTNCSIQEIKWDHFNGLTQLHKLYLYNCKLRKIEPLYFQNLRVLWLARNNLESLSFLGQGLVCLQELNVAQNEITHVAEEQLFKCVNLLHLNLSGNPICVIQDLKAIRVVSTLKSLFLCDPLYGKCPVATLCDSRSMLLSSFSRLSSLDGKRVTSSELQYVKEYIKSRCLYYYAEISQGYTRCVMRRKTSVANSSKHLECIGARLKRLIHLAARMLMLKEAGTRNMSYQELMTPKDLRFYRRAINNVEVVPIFTTAKNLMKDQLFKIETRISKLMEWKNASLKRLEVIMHISRWEQDVEKWFRILEFQTFGNIQFRLSHSVHGSNIEDGGALYASIHELLSALACPGLWPPNTHLKVDTVMSIRDKGLETGMERVFFDNFAWKDEPKFIPPEPVEIDKQQQVIMNPLNPFRPPNAVTKPVSSYVSPDYQPPPPAFSFPDSVPGLPERSQPLFLWLVTPPSWATNPLGYLDKVIHEKNKSYKEIRFTNCFWMANHCKSFEKSFCVAIVMKVLEECLQPVPLDKKATSSIMRHSLDCGTFSVKKSLCFAPAYVIAISFSQENKNALWCSGIENEDDILIPGEMTLTSLIQKIKAHGPGGWKQGKHSCRNHFHVKKIGDGFHADLAAIRLHTTTDGQLDISTILTDSKQDSRPIEIMDTAILEKIFPKETALTITSLDLSGNNLGLVTGLNLPPLKKLNLSHNNLTTLTGLPVLPSLIELKAGWNGLRFLQSNIKTLSRSTPKLQTLEILPNPFQDVRDISHVPALLQRTLPLLRKVDIWYLPFTAPSHVVPTISKLCVPNAKYEMENLNYGSDRAYNLFNQALTQLPQFPSSFFDDWEEESCLDMNLSNNYLSSSVLGEAFAALTPDWCTTISRLQLQENSITTLEWLTGRIFPNCYTLDLSVNSVDDINGVTEAFPRLKHLHLNNNPLPCNLNTLSTLPALIDLLTLDCSSSPISKHPDYGNFVLSKMPSVRILDGSPISQWQTMDAADKMGGVLTSEWLEEKLGQRDWGSISQLSLGGCGLQKISLPSSSMTKLLSLDLQDNNLNCLGNLSSLLSLKVLCVSHNNISSLGGNPCPVCYCHTVESQVAHNMKLRGTASTAGASFQEWNGKSNIGVPPTRTLNRGTGFDSFGLPIAQQGSKSLPCHVKNDLRNTGATAWGFNVSDSSRANDVSPPECPSTQPKRILSRPLFPKLEVLIMSHNGLSAASDLHLHSMQNLQTIILNCNNLTNFQGLDNIPTVRALVLDHNKIRDVPFNSLSGCKSLKYLHLEHNRITTLPRLPHLSNLTSLYLAHNKIQSLTDVPETVVPTVNEISLYGNPVAFKTDYRQKIANKFAQLLVLDGKDLAFERIRIRESGKFHEKLHPIYQQSPGNNNGNDACGSSRDVKSGNRDYLLRAKLPSPELISPRYSRNPVRGKTRSSEEHL